MIAFINVGPVRKLPLGHFKDFINDLDEYAKREFQQEKANDPFTCTNNKSPP